MANTQLTEEFIKEINTGYRSRKLQHLIDSLAEETVGAAYLAAIDKVQRQKDILTQQNIKEFIAHNSSFYDNSPPASEQFRTLTSLLNINSQNVLFVRVDGDSMKGANIDDNDILIASQTAVAAPGTVIIAKVGQNLYVKRYKLINNKVWLYSENAAFKPVEITNKMEFQIVGIVKNVIKNVE